MLKLTPRVSLCVSRRPLRRDRCEIFSTAFLLAILNCQRAWEDEGIGRGKKDPRLGDWRAVLDMFGDLSRGHCFHLQLLPGLPVHGAAEQVEGVVRGQNRQAPFLRGLLRQVLDAQVVLRKDHAGPGLLELDRTKIKYSGSFSTQALHSAPHLLTALE